MNNLTTEEQGIVRAFGELYMGRHAQRLRDNGDPNAMPPWMVSLDSLHTYEHVAREFEVYAPVVAPGCALVVEDVGLDLTPNAWGNRAVEEFLAARFDFVVDSPREKHLATGFRWMRRTQ